MGFEVLTAVVMNSFVFWDATPSSPVKVNGCFDEDIALRILLLLNSVLCIGYGE
jgi:hypothetical protein